MVIIRQITFVPTVNTLFLFMLNTEHDKMHVLNYEKLLKGAKLGTIICIHKNVLRL